ncbi:MAG: DUF853 family protein [Lachnospiraceae bacterium]|nr:DUF853 family protein [Lachnospiraceae bacterium]
MIKDGKVLLGKSGDEEICIYPKMANRHGLIAGATGTGKTVTLKVMAESFSKLGVPVFLADVKGDLAPLVKPGVENENVNSRVESMGLKDAGYEFDSFPVNMWDVYGEKGMPLRTTISEIGPLLLSRIMGLNDTQSDILNIVFKIADDEGLLLIDTKDLKSMIQYVGENRQNYATAYGNIAQASLNAITRGVVSLESEGADKFFGEPALSIADFLCTDNRGRGMIQLLDCQKLILSPKMYSTFLLWLMSELFENLPEVGDCDRPKMVFFFDEAHMLFDSASKDLLDKIEQVVKLIRSKGVGIYFITQNPKDIPDGILAQLGNKVQHALRAYTPAEQKGVKAAAQSFRENPEFDTYTVLQELSTGEALVSVLDESGVPTIAKRVKICPPESFMGTIDDSERTRIINNSLLYSRYSNFVDRDSAYEFLERRNTQIAENAIKEEEQLNETKRRQKEIEAKKKAGQKAVQSVAKTTAGTIGRQVGKTIGGSIGGSFGKTLGGNLGASLGRGILSTLFGGK